MLIAPAPARRTGAALVITVLAVVFLGAMAFAIPPGPIAARSVEAPGVERGLLVGHARFSVMMAEQIANNGYTYLAIDLTGARLDGAPLWKEHLEQVAKRFPVWGFFDLRGGTDKAFALVRSMNLEALYVYGPGAVKEAAALRHARKGLRVIPVVRARDPRPDGPHAVALDAAAFSGSDAALPVLMADRLDVDRIAGARAGRTGNYLVAQVALLDW